MKPPLADCSAQKKRTVLMQEVWEDIKFCWHEFKMIVLRMIRYK